MKETRSCCSKYSHGNARVGIWWHLKKKPEYKIRTTNISCTIPLTPHSCWVFWCKIYDIKETQNIFKIVRALGWGGGDGESVCVRIYWNYFGQLFDGKEQWIGLFIDITARRCAWHSIPWRCCGSNFFTRCCTCECECHKEIADKISLWAGPFSTQQFISLFVLCNRLNVEVMMINVNGMTKQIHNLLIWQYRGKWNASEVSLTCGCFAIGWGNIWMGSMPLITVFVLAVSHVVCVCLRAFSTLSSSFDRTISIYSYRFE